MLPAVIPVILLPNAGPAFPWLCKEAARQAATFCHPEPVAIKTQEQPMQASQRNLILGLVGMAVLLISMLVYAQYNASHNYNLDQMQLPL